MQIKAFRGSRTVTSLRLCSLAPWTTSSSAPIEEAIVSSERTFVKGHRQVSPPPDERGRLRAARLFLPGGRDRPERVRRGARTEAGGFVRTDARRAERRAAGSGASAVMSRCRGTRRGSTTRASRDRAHAGRGGGARGGG